MNETPVLHLITFDDDHPWRACDDLSCHHPVCDSYRSILLRPCAACGAPIGRHAHYLDMENDKVYHVGCEESAA